MVESRDREHSLVFNIMEIQPFRRAAAIQGMSLDADRVSLPTPTLVLWGYPNSQMRAGLCACVLHVILRSSGPQGLPGHRTPSSGGLGFSIVALS